MRKYVAFVAAVAGATLIAPTALAVAHGSHTSTAQASKRDFIVVGRRNSGRTLFIQRGLGNTNITTLAHASSCPAGNLSPSYCSPPKPDDLFGAFAQNGQSTTFGSTSLSTCRALGYTSAPCGVYTNVTNELIVAFVSSDGPSAGGQTMAVTCTTASGGACPVTFKKVASENAGGGDSEVWYADASSIITKTAPIFVTTTAAKAGCPSGTAKCDVSLQAVTFQNAITPGASGVQGTGIGASPSTCYSSKGTPACSLTTTEPDSWVWAEANDWGASTVPTPSSGQTAIGISDGANRKTFYTQYTNAYTPASGTKVTIGDSAPTSEPFNLVAVEIL
jgi:hypothetical protein